MFIFNSVTKKFTLAIYKIPLSTVHHRCNKEKDVAAKCRTLAAIDQLLMASVCQSLSQNWSTAGLILVDIDYKLTLICLLT